MCWPVCVCVQLLHVPFNCPQGTNNVFWIELNWIELGHHQASKQTLTIWWPQSIRGIHTTQITTHQVRGIRLNEATKRRETRRHKRVRMLTLYTTDAHTSYSTRKECNERGEPGLMKENMWNRCHILQKASQSKVTLYEADVFTHILSNRALFLILSAYPHPDVAAVLYFGRTPPHLPPVLSELQFFFPLLCHITIWEYMRTIYPVRPLKFHLYQPSRGKYRMQGNGHHYWALLPGKHNTSFFFWLTLMIGFFLQPWQGSSDAAAMEMRSTSG